jgi:cell wall-associated NlpC family hydrolase
MVSLASACAGTQGFHGAFADMNQTGRQLGAAFDATPTDDGLLEASESQEYQFVCNLQSDQPEELADNSDSDDFAQADSQDDMDEALNQAAYRTDTRRNLQVGFKRRLQPGSSDAQEIDEILKTAFRQVGKNYRTGGSTPSGFDCSGFTTWVFSQSGISLPRSSPEQFRYGRTVAKNDLRAGDLVFFKRRKGISHVGIYVDNGTFIHSTSTGGTVKVSSLFDPSWDRYFAGARRVVQ